MKLSDLWKKRLPAAIYKLVLENVPVTTVDFVCQRTDNMVLLIKRSEGAYSGEWFVGGGRQYRGETMGQALLRITGQEVGLAAGDLIEVEFSHCQDVLNVSSRNDEGELPASHTIWHFHRVRVREGFEPKIDSTSTEWGWFDLADLPLIPAPVQEALKRCFGKH